MIIKAMINACPSVASRVGGINDQFLWVIVGCASGGWVKLKMNYPQRRRGRKGYAGIESNSAPTWREAWEVSYPVSIIYQIRGERKE